MNELDFNKSYHIAYILGTEFETRMYDIYVGMNTTKRPPVLTDVFLETTQMQALLLLEQGIVDNQVLTRHEEELREKVWNNDDEAIAEVLNWDIPTRAYKEIFFDMYAFFDHHRMSLIEDKGTHRSYRDAEVIHSPVMSIW